MFNGNYSATSTNMKLVYMPADDAWAVTFDTSRRGLGGAALIGWPLMGGLLHLVQCGGAWAGCGRRSPPRPLRTVPNVTAHPSTVSVPISVLLYSVSQKILPPWGFLKFFPKRLRIFNKKFTRLLLVHTYAKLHYFIQLSPIMTKLCRIKRDHPVKFYISSEF